MGNKSHAGKSLPFHWDMLTLPTGKHRPFPLGNFSLSFGKLFPFLLSKVFYLYWEKFFIPSVNLIPFLFEKCPIPTGKRFKCQIIIFIFTGKKFTYLYYCGTK